MATFRSGPDWTLNACVGTNNGNLGEFAYVVGFSQASLALLSAAKNQRYVDPRTGESTDVAADALIYPICFTARHHIELFLKAQIPRAACLRNLEVPDRLLRGHGLTPLLRRLQELCSSSDRRLPPLLESFAHIIEEFDTLDPTGQTFRYRKSVQERLHLERVHHINLQSLEEGLSALFDGTEEFDFQMDEIGYEYEQGTFTDHLSRKELLELAGRLAEVNALDDAARRYTLMADYAARLQVPTREFEEAVNVILNHYEFAARAGRAIPLPNLNGGKLCLWSALEYCAVSLADTTELEWRAFEGVIDAGERTAYSEAFDRRMNAPHEDCLAPEDVLRLVVTRPEKVKRGLYRLGQADLLVNLDSALQSRQGENEDTRINEFVRQAQQHFYAV